MHPTQKKEFIENTRKAVRPKLLRWAFAAVWFLGCLAATYSMMGYNFKSSVLGDELEQWPTASVISPSSDQSTLLAFIHPRCVCSEATVVHLTQDIADYKNTRIVMAVYVPEDMKGNDSAWKHGEYITDVLAALPQTEIFYDVEGQQARLFQAHTSGTLVLFNPEGREVFRGGITDRRGGQYDNEGLRTLKGLMAKEEKNRQPSSPVFGCSLHEDMSSEG